MKKYILVLLASLANFCNAFEPPYDADSQKQYLKSKSVIVMGVKISGAIGIQEYRRMMDGLPVDQDSLDLWKTLNNTVSTDNFLVIKSYKLEESLPAVVKAKQLSQGHGVTRLKETYIIFLDQTDSAYLRESLGDVLTYTECDVVNVDHLKPAQLKVLKDYTHLELVDFLVSNRLIGCN